MSKTLYDKIWDSHLVTDLENGNSLLYIDRQLLHEVTTPQAFEGLKLANRNVRQTHKSLAVSDHNVPTKGDRHNIEDKISKLQIDTLEQNCKDFGVEYLSLFDIRQGIVHVMGSEEGFILPATTAVCGDSHTSTLGAFGTLAFGIGTSEVEHVLATQTIIQQKSKNLKVNVTGTLNKYVSAKDVILHIIGALGTDGGTGYVIEYCGDTIESFSMEERMTICNMTIEAGARAGLIAPDQTTFDYLQDKPRAPKGDLFNQAVSFWKTMHSDNDAIFDKVVNINAEDISTSITWGTSPEDVIPITGVIPNPQLEQEEGRKSSKVRSLEYMGLTSDIKIKDVKVDRIFIGSCTNGRISDLRIVADVIKDKKIAKHVHAMIVPGSGKVKKQAEDEGLDTIFINSGFEWRDPGCSMCLAMNDDKLNNKERCVSTSNRNFEGRQGRGGRTHLASPAVAAASAIKGYIADVLDI